jgi:calcineurin-like phosphoesterase family protein
MAGVKTLLFLGDTHGDLAFVESAAALARQHSATEIVQLGDFGFLWPGHDQLQDLSDMLVGLGITMRFVDGNHDDHPRLRKYVSACVATTIAPNVIYQPRGSVHEDEDGTRFLFLGGAPSIDRANRLPGLSWWPEEIITEAEFKRARSAKGPIHVIVTHDAPAFPPGFSGKGYPNYQIAQLRSMKIVDALIKKHRPLRLIHGHWHTRATTQRGTTLVEALDCNQLDPTYLEDSVLLWSREHCDIAPRAGV